ncbi:hypothetical protein D9757_009953 [Collybiopsis confluens]|uniref:DUF6534 domain-containing protein n=1 Tax=Collybiopsis confluens TaxID=2823264 RepID=A0A8H5H2D9_9AGAR|nr:hypothetical protein D9757_009953 [Collybiopsis confluens]
MSYRCNMASGTRTHHIRNGNPEALIAAPKSTGKFLLPEEKSHPQSPSSIRVVQGFFTYRIYVLSPKPYLIPIFSVLLILAQLVTVVTLAVKAITVASVSITVYVEEWGALQVATLWLRVVSDLTVSGSLVYFLIKQRNSAYQSTILIVDKLIRWAIGKLLYWIVVVNTDVDLWAETSHGYNSVGDQLFSNTLMANINSRASLRTINSSLGHVGTIRNSFVADNSGQRMNNTIEGNLNVTVTTELETFGASEVAKPRGWPMIELEPGGYVDRPRV